MYRTGKRRSNSHFTVFFRANQLPESRFGFSIKKALGGAVVRNRIRRRVREIVRCHRQEIPAGWDIVIHPKKSVERAAFALVTADLLRLVLNPSSLRKLSHCVSCEQQSLTRKRRGFGMTNPTSSAAC